MSIQFGRWNFDGTPVDRNYLEKAKACLCPYPGEDVVSYSNGNISVFYRAVHATKESQRETQPQVTRSGAAITWDGRLDNRADLVSKLKGPLRMDSTDIAIVAAAYEECGLDCFAELIGDWALSIWDPNTRSLILAKDPIGIRHLYYSFDQGQVTWSTILDPLVLLAETTLKLREEYVAGWLVSYPAAHLTPYIGIHSVPPSSSVLLRAGKQTIRRHWDFDPNKTIRYRTDREYEENFHAIISEAVRRRLRSHSPILAELSGGMDSSSIVCIADQLIAQEKGGLPRLDTVSYYDDSEPNWNERPYFTKVEEQRGRAGYHVDLSLGQDNNVFDDTDYLCLVPGSAASPSETARHFFEYTKSQGYRVLLSGIGGDEALGGVPNPVPELADLLLGAQAAQLAHQLKAWALAKRKPWIHLLWETATAFLPATLSRLPEHVRKAPWLHSKFVKQHESIFLAIEPPFSLFGPRPSFQSNLFTLSALRNEMTSKPPERFTYYEKRYPYLDRDLLEFLYAIPREQLVRPRQRRSLMRRALRGIVPTEILERRRKAFVVRRQMTSLDRHWPSVSKLAQRMTLASLGVVDSKRFLDALQEARSGREVAMPLLMRTLGLELWLRSIQGMDVPNDASSDIRQSLSSSAQRKWVDSSSAAVLISAEQNTKQKGGENHELFEARNASDRACSGSRSIADCK